jgi:hypothetical protein
MSDPWRNKYVSNRLTDAKLAKTEEQAARRAHAAHLVRLRRDATVVEIGGTTTYAAILAAAIARAKAAVRARGLSDDLYGTWHQHNSTKSAVFDQFRDILRDLDLSPAEVREHVKTLDEEWGSGASLYFD